MSKIKSRVNETSLSFEGQLMTIIAYRNNKDIDIRFEDGVIVTNKTYFHFKNGTIKNPQKLELERSGEVVRANNGQMMKIIAYRRYDDIDIQFEDGTVVYNKEYASFKEGSISNPNFRNKRQVTYVGKTAYSSKNGLMTIVAYRSNTDIDIQFEDGTIVRGKTLSSFRRGYITNPNNTKCNCIGMTSIHEKTGQKMTIIDWRSNTDIDIKFEDGTVVYNKSFTNFKKGQILHSKFDRTGETGIANNGLKMKIVDYVDNRNLTVEFEDGYRVLVSGYSSFKDGHVGHPKMRKTRGNYFSKSSELYNFRIFKLAYMFNSTSNYICQCKKCKFKDILTVTEMKEHICKEDLK